MSDVGTGNYNKTVNNLNIFPCVPCMSVHCVMKVKLHPSVILLSLSKLSYMNTLDSVANYFKSLFNLC